ncbi:3 beta-hydroxysteroid dehydrogenase/Delta 5--_4-isomerase [Planctomycetes bacterium Poly30]|uniref:3 beta-hydroxysteroid dehydrogenase/Delta 5-->4-isomerase n=1 Tax=Saltatorellus ferox TaxID=2528018 RepID=A0A518EPE2_9BACT|nr:3 beta-hydroxysteroid dehydrogenase/Delta 5-->4-isomerase [Planctomycetes bacterium Poly30]
MSSGLHGTRILVTGATGFLGGAVARSLRAQGAAVLGQGRNPEATAAMEEAGLTMQRMALEDRAAVFACFDAFRPDHVVHCAAKSAPFGRAVDFVRANVDGTRHLLGASRASGVVRFVHVSSPSIYCAGRPLQEVSEDTPLPKRAINAYAETKRAAEQLVLEAHRAGVSCVILRPRAIYGPGDNALFPRLLMALKDGKLPIIGDGANRIDLTYVDDAVASVRLALRADERCLGQAYNITSGEAVRLWDLIGTLADRLGLERPTRRISRRTAHVAAAVLESSHRLLRRPGEPRLTRHSVDSLSLDATLDISAARRDLGYEPRVSVEEGVARFLASLERQPAAP